MTFDDALRPRQIADAYVEILADLDPIVGTGLGIRPGDHSMPDYSPAGHAALADAQRAVLTELDRAEQVEQPAVERRAGRLLRERLTATLAGYDAGEHLRDVNNLFSPAQSLRAVFLLMPMETEEHWAVIARRLAHVPEAARSYRASLDEGMAQGLLAAPRQVETVVEQLGTWIDGAWYSGFVAAGPPALERDLHAGADVATDALIELREYLASRYVTAAAGTPDAVGRQRYAAAARLWTGSDLDLEDAYAYGWQEFHRLKQEIRAAAARILPAEEPLAVMRHLSEHGEAVDGEEQIRAWLQRLMDDVIAELHGTHFDLAEPIRTVEAMIAPPGTAAAGYYTRPSLDFTRPGRTWLPTLGKDRFPVWNLVSMWYHEGVPGHHLQLAQWVYLQDQLSRYQVSVGSVSATTEGWALYAERLMDELGYLEEPAYRLGYLDDQMLRAVRVITDIGMHLELEIPAGSGFHPGETWTPQLAREFLGRHSGSDAAFIDSEIVRYLGMPGQAIGYKLGERAWLAGREAARAAANGGFDLKAWHMAALSLGSLGLDDLTDELAQLP